MTRTGRSPAYPSMALPEAIERTHKFYSANKRYAVDRTNEQPVAYTSIGYGSPNGSAKRALAALLAYGLLEKAPGTGESKVRISERGYSIVALPDDDPDKAEAIKAAALEPKLYADLIEEFSDGLPASDSQIQSYLIKTGFNREVLPSIISDFRATVEFASVFESTGENEPRQQDVSKPFSDERKQKIERLQEALQNSATVDYTIPLPGGEIAMLRLPKRISKQGIEFVSVYLRLLKDALTGSISDETKALMAEDEEKFGGGTD